MSTIRYTLRVCIFEVGSTLLAGCCIVYLKFGNFRTEYTLSVCIWEVEILLRYSACGHFQKECLLP